MSPSAPGDGDDESRTRRRRRDRRVFGLVLIVSALGPLAALLFTTHKLERMQVVRGALPGARYVDATVVRLEPGSTTTWVHCGHDDLEGARRPFRTNRSDGDVPRLGDTLVLAILPDGDVEDRDGIWASDDNQLFDRALQVFEVAFALALGVAGLIALVIASRVDLRPDP